MTRPSFRVKARQPTGALERPTLESDPDRLQAILEDAAHYPGGHARGLVSPRTEAEVSACLQAHNRILPIGAQSSLTGGATPKGEVVLTTAALTKILEVRGESVRVQAGVPLSVLQDALNARELYYPPAPTFDGAFVGGTVATNAAGAATFKYGTTRDWVRGLTVVLSSGDVLDLVRGGVAAHPDGYFEIEDTRGHVVRVPVPTYRMPSVAKRSAGYHAAPGMDLIDLFVGSEGTLGIITEATLRVIPRVAALCLAFVPFPSERDGLAIVAALRAAAENTWRTRNPAGIDIAAIEYMDRRCLNLLREEGQDRKFGVELPDASELAILVQLELPTTTTECAFQEIGSATSPNAPDTPLVRFCRMLLDAGAFEAVALALPGDRQRAAQLLALREAVPVGVNSRVGLVKRTVDASIEKVAADMIVPFDHIAEILAIYRDGFERRGLDYAIWGHLSDGNLHPNLLPRSLDDVRAAKEAILEFGRAVVDRGGCPLAEHGVGRNPIKQALLRRLYGQEGIEQMRAVKRALDPDWKLAPGVLFPEP